MGFDLKIEGFRLYREHQLDLHNKHASVLSPNGELIGKFGSPVKTELALPYLSPEYKLRDYLIMIQYELDEDSLSENWDIVHVSDKFEYWTTGVIDDIQTYDLRPLAEGIIAWQYLPGMMDMKNSM